MLRLQQGRKQITTYFWLTEACNLKSHQTGVTSKFGEDRGEDLGEDLGEDRGEDRGEDLGEDRGEDRNKTPSSSLFFGMSSMSAGGKTGSSIFSNVYKRQEAVFKPSKSE